MKFLNQKNPVRDRLPVATVSSNRGYIALISTIIISLILVGLTSILSTGGYFTRASAANDEYKRISLGLAESCVNAALLNIANNPNYLGNQPSFPVGLGTTCDIKPVAYYNPDTSSDCSDPTPGYDSNGQKVACITTQASFQGAFSKMQITAKVQDPNVVYTPPTTLVVYASASAGDSLPSNFHIMVGGVEVNSGAINTFSPGPYTVSETHSGDYVVMFGGDCGASGNITLIADESHACNIYYKEQDNTAMLAVVANIFPSGGVSSLQIKNNSTGDIQSGISPNMIVQVPANVSYTISATTPAGYQASKWSGACDPDTGVTGNLAAGINYSCVINFSPPAPACADTVMMLDRTGSMAGSELVDERIAAKALLDLYAPLTPAPKVGVGVFKEPGASNTLAPAKIVGSLTETYNPVLYDAIDTGLAFAEGNTNLSSAIDVGHNELVSHGDPATANVLILISDGATNRPTPVSNAVALADNSADTAKLAGTQIYTIHFGENTPLPSGITSRDFLASLANDSALDHFLSGNTGFLSPSQYSQESSTNKWTNPDKAYTDDGVSATDIGGHKERYYNFNFPNLSGNTINDVDVKANAWVSGNTGNSVLPPATASDDSSIGSNPWISLANIKLLDTIFSTTSLNAGQVSHYLKATGFGFNIPSNAVINGITANVTRKASRNSTNSGGNQIVDNSVKLVKGGSIVGDDKAASTNWGTSNGTVIPYGSGTDLWGTTWTAADINNANFGIVFSAKRTGTNSNSNTASVDYISLTVYYTNPVNNTACQLGVEISYDGGSHWSAQQVSTLDGNNASVVSFGGAGAKWVFSPAHSWQPTDFGNTISKFLVRVQDIDPDPGSDVLCTDNAITNLDLLQSRVDYTTANVDVAAENADGDNFYISPSSADMKGIFEDIGRKVCPAAAGTAQSKINISTQVINSNGGVGGPGDFHITVLGASASPGSFDGSGSAIEVIVSPGTSFDIGVSTPLTNYFAPQYIGCSPVNNTVAAGETAFCTIVNYDEPPDPTYTSPNLPAANITIDSWEEKP